MECRHAPCTCLVEDANGFCSESCRGAASMGAGEMCACGHPECAGLSEAVTGGMEPI
jgi:hypothetical protein